MRSDYTGDPELNSEASMPPLVKNPVALIGRLCALHQLQTQSPDLARLAACDIIQSIPQTEVWFATPLLDGKWAVAQAKLTAYDLPRPEDYPNERLSMRGGDASRLGRRWGQELRDDHQAYAEVHALAACLGTAPRKEFIVIALKEQPNNVLRTRQPEPAPDEAEHVYDPAEGAIIKAIGALLPLLSSDGASHVRSLLS